MTFQKKMDDFLVETPTSCLTSAGLLAWTLLCAIQDSRQKRISNWLTLTAAALAGGFLLWQGHSLTGSAPAAVLAGLALALALSLPGYIGGKMGAGDVKLLAALALASSPLHVLGSIAGAALCMLAWTLGGPALWQRLPGSARRQLALLEPGQASGLPYAPFFFGGLLMSMVVLA